MSEKPVHPQVIADTVIVSGIILANTLVTQMVKGNKKRRIENIWTYEDVAEGLIAFSRAV